MSISNEFSNEQKDKIESLKKKLKIFTSKLIEKFDSYIISVALIPPQKIIHKKQVNLLVIVNDSDRRKLSRAELKKKVSDIVYLLAKDVDNDLNTETVLISEIWNNCLYGQYEVLDALKGTAIVYDRSFLKAIKFTLSHKQLALNKFENYIISYILHGDVANGTSTEISEINIGVIIDDSDVKRIGESELKEKIDLILSKFSLEIKELMNIENRVSIKTFLLSNLWERLKEGDSEITKLIREGVPFYDKGMFTPWKNLLEKGKLKPSEESITAVIEESRRNLEDASNKIKEVAETIYSASFNACRSALMLYGDDKIKDNHLIERINEVFVKNEKVLEKEYIKTLVKISDANANKDNLKWREIDDLIQESRVLLSRISRLFDEIKKRRTRKEFEEMYMRVINAGKSILACASVENVEDENICELFRRNLVESGKIPEKHFSTLKKIITVKNRSEKDNSNSTDYIDYGDYVSFNKLLHEGDDLISELVKLSGIMHASEMQRNKIRIIHNNVNGEIFFGKDCIYLIEDINKKEIREIKLYADGSLGSEKNISHSVFLETTKNFLTQKVKERTFQDIKNLLQGDLEIFLN